MAITKDILLDAGADHVEVFDIEVLTDPSLPYDSVTNPYIPLDLTGYTARSHVRKTYDTNTILIELSTALGNINLGSNGRVTLTFTPSMSDSIKFTGDTIECYYDLELVSGVSVKRVVQGTFTISKNITR